jgi:hypothetical protein
MKIARGSAHPYCDWTSGSPPPTYPLPDLRTTQNDLAHFVFHYDGVGNATTIEDNADAGQCFFQYAYPMKVRDMQYADLYRVTSVDYGYGAGGPTTYLLGAELTSQVATREYTYDSTLAPSLTCSVGCRETRMREQFEALVHDVVCRACTRWLRSDPRHRSRRRSQASRRCPAPAL